MARNEINPEDKKRVTRSGLQKILGIFRFTLPHKWYLTGGLVFLFLGTITTLSFPYFLGEMVNAAQPKGESPEGLPNIAGNATQNLPPSAKSWLSEVIPQDVNSIAWLLVIILLIQSVLSFARVYFAEQLAQRTTADIRYAAYRKLITFGIPFFEQRRVGELTSRLSSDVTQLHDVLSLTLFEFLRQIVVLIGGLAIMFMAVSSRLTLFMLSIFPLIIIGAIVFGRFIRKMAKKTQDQLAETNTVVDETLHAILVVKAFANELMETIRYRTALGKVVELGIKTAVYRGFFTSYIFAVLFGGVILIIWRGATMIQSGEIAVGDLVTFVVYTAFIAGSVAGLGSIYSQLQKTVGASERLQEILDRESEFELPDEPVLAEPRLKGEIDFEDVSFSYPARPEVSVLQQISFGVQPGQKVALVGQSGAGKSTLAQLLLRFYEIEQGKLKIDGKEINTYDLPYLRANMGIVPQEVILFGGTIRENIGYGNPQATEKEIIQAAQQANAWEFIQSFPEKLDTLVGERGIKLSGGQRQRIAIARAILKDPVILLLDEATSSLDAESEQLVQAALNELMKGRTTLIIAHRLSTIRTVDQIYVLQDGKIIESGTHDQLAAMEEGAYHHLLKLQLEPG